MAVTSAARSALAQAYDSTGSAWQDGPARLVYDRLAGELVARSPVPLAGRLVLDVGAGTGAAARSVVAAGGRPVALDVSFGMLQANPAGAKRAVVGDAECLAIATGSVNGVVAAFSFNHVHDPVAAFREAARVCSPGSPILAAAYAADDHHPVKQAVDQALGEVGWVAEPWYDELRTVTVPRLATVEAMTRAAHAGGLNGLAEGLVVRLDDLSSADLVSWRLGMAQVAAFLAGLAPAGRQQVRVRAQALLGDDHPPLRRSIVIYAGLT